MNITLQHLTKTFPARGRKAEGETTAVRDLSFTVPDGQLVGLLGPSGCGKSTTLNMICGLEAPTSGKILFGEEDVTALPPELRGVGMVFQNYALYPHLTVMQNILFPLQNLKGDKRPSRAEMQDRARKVASLVQIEELLDRKPRELSGGQQQRVAIARAIAARPPLILADEPTGNLDSATGREVMDTLLALNGEGHTIILITHDPGVAAMAGRIVRIQDGRMENPPESRQIYIPAPSCLSRQ